MVELKFNEINSLNAVTGALHKNGYKYSTFIIWKKDNGGIDYFAVHIEGVQDVKNEQIDTVEVIRCNNCEHRYLNKHGEPCCEIWKNNRDTVVRDCDFCSYGKRRINV